MTKKILFACFALLAVAAYLVSAKPSKKSKNADDSAAKEALRTATKDFVRIEAGTFMMGTVGGGNFGNLPFDENEAHSVTLTRSYYMCDHEVTNAEYKAVMGKVHRLNKGGDNVPVVYVSWNNMIDYCNKLSELQGLTPCYTKEKGKVTCDFTANGYRLPTDAEWERAARAGNDTTELLTYNGITEDSSLDKETKDSLLGEYAWHPFNSGRKLHPVKEKKPNAWGLYDMIGNVWEVCWDFSSKLLNGEPATDPTGPASAPSDWTCHVTRGGGFYDPGPVNTKYMTESNRHWGLDEVRSGSDRYGFRVVRTADD